MVWSDRLQRLVPADAAGRPLTEGTAPPPSTHNVGAPVPIDPVPTTP
jgi:hypothetical protein